MNTGGKGKQEDRGVGYSSVQWKTMSSVMLSLFSSTIDRLMLRHFTFVANFEIVVPIQTITN